MLSMQRGSTQKRDACSRIMVHWVHRSKESADLQEDFNQGVVVLIDLRLDHQE